MAATTLAGAFAQGVDASKPAAAASLEGYCYFSTDINGGTLYQCKSSAWVQLTPGVSALKPNGLTGATSASRYAGATTSGAPVSGTFAVGDFVIDQTGKVWVCTVAGTPGTWASASGGGVTSATGTSHQVIVSASTGAVTFSTPQNIDTTSSPTFASLAAGGLTGAVAGGRFAGATASGAPASGTFSVGDFVIDQTGKVWVCTGAGSPGTWVQVGGSSGAVTQVAVLTAGGSSGTFDFTSISGAYNSLMIVLLGRSTRASNNNDGLNVQMNGDSGAHYSSYWAEYFKGGSSTTNEVIDGTSGGVGILPAATSGSNDATGMTIWIPAYAGTTFNKTWHFTGFYPQADLTTDLVALVGGGRFASTSAITRVTLALANGNFVANSQAILYGIA